MSHIFLSHSSTNNAEAVALRDWLAGNGWKDEIFLDLDPQRGIAAGERWERALHEAASRCEAVLFLVSKAWLASVWCRKEEAHVHFSAEGLQRLKHGLEEAGLNAKYFAWPPQNDPDRPPYRGLRPLEAEDAGIFFGREAPIIEALDRLRGLRETTPPRLLVILGASGAGKSSFLRAGLFPRLARDDRNFLPLPVIRPERAAISGENGLLASLENAFAATKIAIALANLRSAISGGDLKLKPLLQSLADRATPLTADAGVPLKPPTIALLIDQAEELFIAEAQEERQPFLALLRDLLMEDPPAIIAVLTIRSDNYERLQLAEELQGVRQETFSLPPMPKGSYAEVIKGPARRLEGTTRQFEVEDGLVDALLTDVEAGGSKDALPLLAFTLQRLYGEYHAEGHLKLSQYDALGRVKGSIEAAVERALKAADADSAVPRDRASRLKLLRRGIIPWLASIDPDTGAPRRRVARLSEIPAEARPLIQHLVEQRLLATDVNRDSGEATVEPAHEALLRQWGLLQGWLAEDAGLLAVLDGVKRASRDWTANNRIRPWLIHTTDRLVAAERLSERPDLAANLERADREYIVACRMAETDLTRGKRIVQGIIYVLVVGVIAGLLGWINESYLRERWRWFTIVRPYMTTQVRPHALTAEAERALKPGLGFRECAKDCPMMVVIPAGKFVMGSPANELGRNDNEGPQHEVTVTQPFAASKFEVTFDEWDACVAFGDCAQVSDSSWGHSTRPVINVTWHDAQQYVAWLSKMTGKAYRLLTEAEWEYAARAGTTTAYFWGDDIGKGNANCAGCGSQWDSQQTAPTGSFAANPFGLHDMHGNVWEWVEDCYQRTYNGAPTAGSAWISDDCINRVVRGGSWIDRPLDLRSAYRGGYSPVTRDDSIGFRVGRTL